MKRPVPIPFPLSSFPGINPQEGAGRLINCYAEPLGEPSRPTGPAQQVWRGTPGLSQHAITAQTGYRGGLLVRNLSYEVFKDTALTVDANGVVNVLGAFPGTKGVSIARNLAANPDVVAVDLDNGAYILNTTAVASATVAATIAGGSFVAGDKVALFIANTSVPGFPVTVTYTVVGGDTATNVATGLKNLINANATLAAANLTASNVAGVLTISQQGAVANATMVSATITGTGSETVTFNPVSGQLAGGAGTPGIVFTGVPLFYNGLGGLPQPNGVAFQDGYFFFTIGDNRCFATALNSLSLNSLTYITVQGRADANLLRPIPFSNMLLLFTTGSFEVWQDQGIAAPAFPYGRLTIVDIGLAQPTAIAGYDVGFAELLWVSQDYHVQWMSAGSIAPNDVSPPDLNRLIERAALAGQTLEAGCAIAGGKKFWRISCPDWSWEINLSTKRWHERWSLNGGVYGRCRWVGGHPAFNKWIVGDTQSGNLLYPDNDSYSENGAPYLFRIESGPVREFPNATRIARADFDFTTGVGQEVGNYAMRVLGAAAGTGGVVRLTVDQTAKANSGDEVNVVGVTGTTEANGPHPMRVVDQNHIELTDTPFVNAYVSGGVATDISSPPEAVNPQVAISCSQDGGYSFDNPSLRSLAPQGRGDMARASVKNRGLAGPQGVRWRLDITDPVYRGLKGGTMSDNPQEVRP